MECQGELHIKYKNWFVLKKVFLSRAQLPERIEEWTQTVPGTSNEPARKK